MKERLQIGILVWVPLETVELILSFIRATTPQAQLRVSAEFILDEYRNGFNVRAAPRDVLTLTCDTPLPQLNRTISPNSV